MNVSETAVPVAAKERFQRRFSTQGVDPYDMVKWERRQAKITNQAGKVVFCQDNVDVPATWSMNATNILAQKYFRGHLGEPNREFSLRQVVNRVVNTIVVAGVANGYFLDDEEASVFSDELKVLLITQRAAFNSPVWFNVGAKTRKQQVSACFLLDVEDSMPDILNWYVEEGLIFQGGSGAGINLSKIRGSQEGLSAGGRSSGPVSFMRGADASAGSIASGGATRRAAKMVILNADHPDIEEFIECKAKEEHKIRALMDAGFDMGVAGSDIISVQYQNANNSVRVTDEFMQAVLDDGDWDLIARTTGKVVKTMKARELFRKMAQAAWECADPGILFDTTINRWHTLADTSRITTTNPCFPGTAKVHTDKGLVPFSELIERVNRGEEFGVYTHDATRTEEPAEVMHVTSPEAFLVTGRNPIVRLNFDNGMVLRCTPGHKIFTTNRGFVPASDLTSDDSVKLLDLPAPADKADWALPVSSMSGAYRERFEHLDKLDLPEEWTEEFAHFLGWLIGDGSTSGHTSAIYGSEDDRSEILPLHKELLEGIKGSAIKTVPMANGTVQLRLARNAFKRFLEALGVKSVKGPEKVVPWSIEQAPPEIVAAFLRGLFDADGCVSANEASATRYVGLTSASPELVQGVQVLLATFGVQSRIYVCDRKDSHKFSYTRKDGSTASYETKVSYDLRISGNSLRAFAESIGFSLSRKTSALADVVFGGKIVQYKTVRTARLVSRVDDGVELTYNLTEPRNHSYVVDGIVVRNCGEYHSVTNSSCNLSSINVLAFLQADGMFDAEGFAHTCEVMFTAQEICIAFADFPTEKIAEGTRKYRQIGLGFANLGATLMAMGVGYDSNPGRAFAAALASAMTGTGYAQSARLAERVGPFRAYEANKDSMRSVLEMHRQAARTEEANGRSYTAFFGDDGSAVAQNIDCLSRLGREAWDAAIEGCELYGVRNSQCSLLAPTGTISLMMDCDTTGIEPAFSLRSFKQLVGGGSMSFAIGVVPRALQSLGYDPQEIDAIVAYVAEHGSLAGAPGFRPEHAPVFATAVGDDPLEPMAHVMMIAAVQPFLSGAVSKTCNLPAETSVEDIENFTIEAWRLGVKALAIYRDGCKAYQPLSSKPAKAAKPTVEVVEVAVPRRERLPRTRTAETVSFSINDLEGYYTVGLYPDGRLGELFMKVSKQGSTLAGIMDAFAIAISLGLQFGVPLETYCRKYVNMSFEPAGFVANDDDMKMAKSILDFVFRKLAIRFLPYEVRTDMGIFSIQERLQQTLPGITDSTVIAADSDSEPPSPPSTSRHVFSSDAPFCPEDGTQMLRAGSCFACPACGSTSGCS